MYEKYYNTDRVEFNLYGYAPPGAECGDYVLGKNEETGLKTPEAFKDYKDVGFNMVLSGTIGTYYGEKWQGSMCKRVMDAVFAAGIDKYIVGDQAFYDLSRENDGIIGEGKRFKDESALDEFVRERMKDYSAHPAFYGVYLADEPHYYLFKSFGQLYRSIKRVCPKAFIHCNLLPLDTLRWMDERYPAGGDLLERRSKYLNMFLDETGADYIMYDDYPFCYAKENKLFYIRCLQNAAEICRDRKVKFSFVAQSFSMNIGGSGYYWVPNEDEMRWQLHLLLGFGIKELGFFTYMPHNNNAVENFPADGAMILKSGEKNELYFVTQRILKELKEIAPVVTRFEYRRSAYAVKTFNSYLKQLDYALNEKLYNVNSFETDFEGVLINELYDNERDLYLYRVINMSDVRLEDISGKVQNTTIRFDEKFTWADVYADGKWNKIRLDGGKTEISLLPGQAAYVLIYK